jgi:uncharacterized protein YciI
MRSLLVISFVLMFMAANAQSKIYILVLLHKKTDALPIAKDSVERLMKGHLANIQRLAAERKLLAAGPFEGGGGLFILNTASNDEAGEWLKTDPGIQANRWDVEMLQYSPQIGSVCLAKEPYEMVTYDFIRFYKNQNLEEKHLKEHRQLVDEESESGNVVTLADCQPSGNILIMKNDAMTKFLDASPAVQQGTWKPETKKLWIAKGSFCEK